MVEITSKQDASEKTKWLRQQIEEYRAKHPELVSDSDLGQNFLKDSPDEKRKEFMDVLESVERFIGVKDK